MRWIAPLDVRGAMGTLNQTALNPDHALGFYSSTTKQVLPKGSHGAALLMNPLTIPGANEGHFFIESRLKRLFIHEPIHYEVGKTYHSTEK